MAAEKVTLKRVGEDSYKDGFLSKSFANMVIDAVETNSNWRVTLPAEYGTVKILRAKEGFHLDMSGFKPASSFIRLTVIYNGALVSGDIPMSNLQIES